jgi:hypothetical protein
MSMVQLLGFGRDIFLISGSGFFASFITWQVAKRRFSAATVAAIRGEIMGLSSKSGGAS